MRELVDAGLLRPLHLDQMAMRAVAAAEAQVLEDLKSWQGSGSLVRFVEQALLCDDAVVGIRNSLSRRLKAWAADLRPDP